MALAGTLKDFGIADILQLIAQQQKTGVLHLRSKDQEVKVGFVDGAIVSAESVTKKKRDLFGHLLVAAELITEAQLELALETQKRSLQRLGDCLISQGVLTKDQYRRMAQLQFNETLYRLFTWKSGTYEFEQGPVHHDTHDLDPVRAESVLMEGFRMVDEWPVIRKRIPRYDLVFAPGKYLPPGRTGRRRGRVRIGRPLGAPGLRAGQRLPRRAEAHRPVVPRRVRDLQGALQPGQPRPRQRAHAGGRAGPAGGRHRARRPRPRGAGPSRGEHGGARRHRGGRARDPAQPVGGALQHRRGIRRGGAPPAESPGPR